MIGISRTQSSSSYSNNHQSRSNSQKPGTNLNSHRSLNNNQYSKNNQSYSNCKNSATRDRGALCRSSSSSQGKISHLHSKLLSRVLKNIMKITNFRWERIIVKIIDNFYFIYLKIHFPK